MKKKETDIERFKQIIKNQSPIGVRADDWEKVEAEEQRYDNGDRDIKLAAVKIVFCFTKRGRFKGAVNYR